MIRNAFARLASLHPGYLRRAAALAAAVLVVTGLAAAPARASIVTFDSFPADGTNAGNQFGPGVNTQVLGVYFRAEKSGSLSTVVVQMGTGAAFAAVQMALYQWAPGDPMPPGPALDTSDLRTLDEEPSAAREFVGWNGFFLETGTTYAILATVPEGGPAFWTFAADASIDGAGAVFLTAGGWATDPRTQAIRVEVAPIPVPAALPLMGSALAGLGLVRLRRRRAA